MHWIAERLRNNLDDPYTVPYKGIYAICDAANEYAEIIEHSNCYSGAAWSLYHYAKAPLVLKARSTGNMIRYSRKPDPQSLSSNHQLQLRALNP